jgi:TatD DNase family protein
MIDAGVNLASSQFDQDLDAVVQRAQLAGLQSLVAIGTDLASSRQCINLAQRYSHSVVATAGIHPHNADGTDANALDLLRQLAQAPQVRAVGETGLDYNRNFSKPEKQRHAFAAQLEIAAQLGKPVYLHERDAFSDQIDILYNYRDCLAGGVAHCFTGTLEQARAYLDFGLHIGITGWLCDPARGEQLRQTVKHIPLDRLLLETDAPYLMPRHLDRKTFNIPQKRRNEPCLLPLIAEFLADILECSLQRLTEITTHNSRSLFQLDEAKTPE